MSLRQARNEVASKIAVEIRDFEMKHKDVVITKITLDRTIRTGPQETDYANYLAAVNIELEVKP